MTSSDRTSRRAAAVGAVALACVLVGACDPEDQVLSIQGSVPDTLEAPHVYTWVDADGRLHWMAEDVIPPPAGWSYVLWLGNADWTVGDWQNLGPIAALSGQTTSGTVDASLLGVDRPVLVSLEPDVDAVGPAAAVPLWRGAFPRAGEALRPMGFGDAFRGLTLESFVSADGSLVGPGRGFGRFELYYPMDQLVVRLWNFRSPPPGFEYVLWISDDAAYVPLLVLDDLPETMLTKPSDVNAFAPTANEHRVALDYPRYSAALPGRSIPYNRLAAVHITLELAASKLAGTPTGLGYVTPQGPMVLHGEVLAHAALGDRVEGHGGHHH